MKDWHKLKPELFKKNPYYLTGCDSYPGTDLTWKRLISAFFTAPVGI
jgi:hypothetical protein